MDKVIFDSMLYGFGVALKTGFRITSVKDRVFREEIRTKTFSMQIKIRNQNTGRFYKLENGKIISKAKLLHESPDILIDWKDASVAMKIVTTGIKAVIKNDPKLLIHALKDSIFSGDLAVEIEFAPSYAFLESVISMMNSYSGFVIALRKIPYVDPMLKRVPYLKEVV